MVSTRSLISSPYFLNMKEKEPSGGNHGDSFAKHL